MQTIGIVSLSRGLVGEPFACFEVEIGYGGSRSSACA